ncbi:MAG: hypothetical protein AAFY97_03765 [Pseudomonadota bacterium]
MKINWALLGLLAGIGIGAFGQAFGVEWLVAQVRAHVGWIAFACFAALFLIFALGAVLQWLSRRYLQPRYESVSDVLGDATTVVARTAKLSDADTEKAGQIIRSGVAIYGAWSFRLIMLRATVGLLLALGGVFTTYLLIQQNERIAEQTEAVEAQTLAAESQTTLLTQQLSLSTAQNELMALNVVATLRERLASAPLDWAPRIQEIGHLTSYRDFACRLTWSDEPRPLYGAPNQSEIAALADLARSEELGARVIAALTYLLEDRDPSVVLSAVYVFDRLGTLPDLDGPITLRDLAIERLEFNHPFRVHLDGVYADLVWCLDCDLSLTASVIADVAVPSVSSVTNSFVDRLSMPTTNRFIRFLPELLQQDEPVESENGVIQPLPPPVRIIEREGFSSPVVARSVIGASRMDLDTLLLDPLDSDASLDLLDGKVSPSLEVFVSHPTPDGRF